MEAASRPPVTPPDTSPRYAFCVKAHVNRPVPSNAMLSITAATFDISRHHLPGPANVEVGYSLVLLGILLNIVGQLEQSIILEIPRINYLNK